LAIVKKIYFAQGSDKIAECITDPTENKLLLETKNKNDEVLVFDDEIRKEVLGIF